VGFWGDGSGQFGNTAITRQRRTGEMDRRNVHAVKTGTSANNRMMDGRLAAYWALRAIQRRTAPGETQIIQASAPSKDELPTLAYLTKQFDRDQEKKTRIGDSRDLSGRP